MGENVSTAEVEEVVTRGAGMKACVVYGVQIPGVEGRCGMAAVADPEGTLDFDALGDEVRRSLPSYARPLFLRVLNSEMNMTGKQNIHLHNFGSINTNFSSMLC
ncbi:Long-chain fatty acid transport protein 1 [Folsomia candida]|uniref:Long-chain fatty acid transport protein 1 n=1 Tax=Folsomia candida TaxID=158441 RepID=A0A226DGV3_FOLCA|nr:Long-chain fatty acid transport protein 1 [Folsomia candida]